MDAPREILSARWDRLMRALNRDPAGEVERSYGAAFIDAWLEPHRRYHTPAHLIALLDRLERWSERAEDPALLGLAAFAHDAVYRGEPGHDERASAQMAERCGVGLGLAPARIAAMRRWIEATAGHTPQPDSDGQLFLDADLEILASEPEVYSAYARAIREEYAAAPDDLFRAGRAAAMTVFLTRPKIYSHPMTPPGWEKQARRNIEREIAALSSR